MNVTFTPNNFITDVKSVKMYHKVLQKLFLEIILVSSLKTSLLKILKEETFALNQKMTQQNKMKTSQLNLLSKITQVKSKTDIAQFWIATLLILLLNSKKFYDQLIEDLVKFYKNYQNLLNQVKLAWSIWYQKNPFVQKYLPNILLSIDLP